MTTAWDRVIYEEYSFSHSADKTVQDQGTSSTTVLKGMFSVSKITRYAAPLEWSRLVFTTGKQWKSEEMFAETSNPFCKGVNILKDGVCIAQSPPRDWASVCVPLRMMGQSDVLEGTQSLRLWLFVISTLYLWMYNLLYTSSHFLVGSARLSHCPELGSRFKSGC